jgi:hypothetical protein
MVAPLLDIATDVHELVSPEGVRFVVQVLPKSEEYAMQPDELVETAIYWPFADTAAA